MAVQLYDTTFEHPVGIAAGFAKTLDELRVMVRSPSANVIIGTLTGSIEGRTGNPEPNETVLSSIHLYANSKGLPEPPLQYYWRPGIIEEWQSLLDEARISGKVITLSIAPMGDYRESLEALLQLASEWQVDRLELNLGCPNIWTYGLQKQIACFDPVNVDEQIAMVSEVWQGPLDVKFSPYSDPTLLGEVAGVVIEARRHNQRLSVVTANTFPNALIVNRDAFSAHERPHEAYYRLRYIGLSGPAFKPIALGQVAQWAECLHGTDIPVIGVGGITTGNDVRDYQQYGASFVQVGSAYRLSGPKIIERILAKLV